MLAFVDFDALVPAIAAPFVVVAALGRAGTGSMLAGWGGGGVPAPETPPETRRPS
jgi:hypothetical protein